MEFPLKKTNHNMSYTIFIQKFNNGDASPFEFSELESIISKHGNITESEFGLEITSKTEICENADLNGKGKTDISGVSFHRPIHCLELQNLVFDILKVDGTYFFDQELNYLQTRSANLTDVPEDILANSDQGVTLVKIASDVWPK